MMTFLAIFTTLIGALATVLMLILLLAASCNIKPHEVRRMKCMLWLVLGVGLAAGAGAIVAIMQHRPGIAMIVGGATVAFHVVLLVVFNHIEQRELAAHAREHPWNTCRPATKAPKR